MKVICLHRKWFLINAIWREVKGEGKLSKFAEERVCACEGSENAEALKETPQVFTQTRDVFRKCPLVFLIASSRRVTDSRCVGIVCGMLSRCASRCPRRRIGVEDENEKIPFRRSSKGEYAKKKCA